MPCANHRNYPKPGSIILQELPSGRHFSRGFALESGRLACVELTLDSVRRARSLTMKINAKLGGRNMKLDGPPRNSYPGGIDARPFMVLGARSSTGVYPRKPLARQLSRVRMWAEG